MIPPTSPKGVMDMPMEGLLALVGRLRGRIDAHGATFRGSEALTRYALIDPMLRELGWDTSDPDMVIPEYSAGGGRADYALLSSAKPVMMVEAKKLDEALQSALNQAINYSISGTGNKARYFSATDGANWVIYDTSKPPAEMLITSFDLKGPSAAEACLQALSLWRPSVISGRVRPGQAPVVGLPGDPSSAAGTQPVVGPVVQPPPNVDEPGWEPVSTLNPVPSSNPPQPSEILFPDNSRTSIKSWSGLATATVRWLMENNFLTTVHCPIQHGSLYILAASPTHPSGQPMRAYREINSLYLNINYNSRDQVRNSRLTIERVGQDPAQFKVRFP